MFSSQRHKFLLYLKGISITTTPPPTPSRPPKLNPISQNFPSKFFSLTLNLKFKHTTTTTTSNGHSFAVSYLINNCGFSPESALKASKHVRFETPEKPDSVLTLFRNRGFSNSQINSVIRRAPRLLSCDPDNRVLPKFEFLLSKGASTSDIVAMVCRSPGFLHRNLQNHIIPAYELVRRFFQSDQKTIARLVTCPVILAYSCLEPNVKLLLDNGVSHSNIGRLIRTWPTILCTSDLGKSVDEVVKKFGIDPSKSKFCAALLARRVIAKHRWDAKVDAFKSWGWSEEAFWDAFRRQPSLMLASIDRIDALMRFWVNQMGWNSLALVKRPEIFGYRLEKRTIPRAFVVQCLLSKGLINKNASLVTPFVVTEKEFLEKYVKIFKEETSQLLKLYQEKINL